MASDSTRKLHVASNDVVAVGAASALSNAMVTNEIMLVSTTNCWLAFGLAPTAVASTDASQYLPANIMITIKWNPNDKVAVIQDAAGGFLTVTPVSF